MFRIFIIALGLTLLQLSLAILVQGNRSLLSSYEHLNAFDSLWYERIAENGYFSSLPKDIGALEAIESEEFQRLTNVAFFPGYPIAVSFIHRVFAVPTPYALLLVSQIACIGFWIYLLLLLKQLGVGEKMMWLCTLAIVVFPTSFFLITGYSESLFLFCMLGFLYWCNERSRYASVLAALHGLWMSLTRIHGVLISLYALFRSRPWVAAFSMAGAFAFFAYLSFAFGSWDFYFEVQKYGWLIQPDYLFAFNGGMKLFPTLGQSSLDPNQLSSLMTTVMFWILVVLCFPVSYRTSIHSASSCVIPSDFAHSSGSGQSPQNSIEGRKMPNTQCDTAIKCIEVREGLLLLAIILFYLQASAVSSLGFRSMSRYCLPVFILLAIIVSHRVTESIPERRTKYIACIGFTTYCITALALQLYFINLFTHKEWVA